MNKGWWFFTVDGKQKEEGTDTSGIEKLLLTSGMYAHEVSYSDAEAQWEWFVGEAKQLNVVIEGEDYCTVTLTWDRDYDNPGIETIVVGSMTWSGRTTEQR